MDRVLSKSGLWFVSCTNDNDGRMQESKMLDFEVDDKETESVSPVHRPPLTAHPDDTLATVIQLIVSAHVHRVYIVDTKHRPIGAPRCL
jgi:hypothetical protein